MEEADAKRWQVAARSWVQHGAMGVLDAQWADRGLQNARRRQSRARDELRLLRASLAEIESLADPLPEQDELQSRIDARQAELEELGALAEQLEELRSAANTPQPEALELWRLSCIAQPRRAPGALVAVAAVLDSHLAMVPCLREAWTHYEERLAELAARAGSAVVRFNAHQALAETAREEELRQGDYAQALAEDADVLTAVVLKALEAEIELATSVARTRRQLSVDHLLPEADVLADDVRLVPSRLWVRFGRELAAADVRLRRHAQLQRDRWPDWLLRLDARGEPTRRRELTVALPGLRRNEL